MNGLLAILFAFLIYIVFCVNGVSRMPPFFLTYYYVNPDHLVEVFAVSLPGMESLIWNRIDRLTVEDINSELESNGQNIYWYLGVYWNVDFTLDEQSVSRFERTKRVVNTFVSKGVQLNMLDRYGCTALHNAVALNDSLSKEYLVSVGADTVSVGNPQAEMAVCRYPVELD